MNVSGRAQSFTWITPPNDIYVLLTAVSSLVAEEPYEREGGGRGLYDCSSWKSIAVIQLQKMVSHPSSRSGSLHATRLSLRFNACLIPNPRCACSRTYEPPLLEKIRSPSSGGRVTHGDISRRERMGQRSARLKVKQSITQKRGVMELSREFVGSRNRTTLSG